MSRVLTKAVFLDKGSLGDDPRLDFSPLLNRQINWREYPSTQPSSVYRRLKDATIVVTNKVELREQDLVRLPNLSLIVIAATGVNNVDLKAAERLRISVSNSIGYSTQSVAQHTIALLLALSNQVHRYHPDVINRVWSNSPFFCDVSHPMYELSGKSFGIIGYGAIAKRVSLIARSLGMEVLIAEKKDAKNVRPKRVSYNDVIINSDYLSLHCPLTPNNHHMVNEEFITRMKPDASIINTSRGGLIHQQTLLHALDNNLLRSAALDVLEEEPPSKNSRILEYDRSNLVLTPHCAWATLESRQRLIVDIRRNINSWLRGKVRNRVKP